MTERDEVRREVPARQVEELVARAAPRDLDRLAMAFRTRAHSFAAREKRAIERRGEPCGKRFVVSGRRAELMVEMDDAGQTQLAGVGEGTQDVDERDRVRSARDRG